MTVTELFVAIYLTAGVVAVFYAIRKLATAIADDRARILEGVNGAARLVTRGRVRSAWQAVAMSLCFLAAAILAVADQLIPGPALFSIAILSLLTAAPVIFSWKLRDEDRNDAKILALLMRPQTSRDRSTDR